MNGNIKIKKPNR